MINHTYFLDALWSITKDAVLCFDEKGTIQCANPRARDTFAWADSINDFGTVDDLHLAHEDGRPFSWQSWFSENKGLANEVLTCRSLSGSQLRLEAATSRVMVAEKLYLFCRFTNVTQPAEQEHAYAALEEKLYNFFYLCPSAVCVTRISDGLIYEVNKSLIELSEYREEELIGHTTLELGFWTQPEDRHRLVQQLLEKREGQVEAVLRTKSGRMIEGMVNSRAVMAEGARCFVTVFQDVSANKAAERAQLLINQATNDAIYDWNLQNGTVWWNDMVTMFGYRSEEIDDTIAWWHERIHPEDRQRVVDRINAFISKRLEKWFDKYRFKRKDNSYAYVYDKGYFEFTSDGTPVRMVGGMVDITERVLAEESILIKNRQIAEYAFFNSHKLRGPLARLMGLIKLIDFQEAHREENKTLLNHLKVIAEELDELVKDASKVLY